MDAIYPTLFRRYLSTLVDGLFLIALMALGASLLQGDDAVHANARVALFAFLLLGYEPVCTAFGCTLGQRVLGLRVRRDADPGRPIPLWAAYVRYLVKIPLGALSFLTMPFTRHQRALHDLAAGSVMIDASQLTRGNS